MNFWTLLLRSIVYYRRGHTGLFLGVVVTCTVLTGALMTGDSIRGSLRDIVDERLGQIYLAMDTNDRFIRQDLTHSLKKDLSSHVAGVLRIAGVANNPELSLRVNRVQVLGVDQAFWTMNSGPATISNGAADHLMINEKLADRLQVSVGDTIVIRIEKPSILPRDAVLVPTEAASIAIRLAVARILRADEVGNFNLSANQIAPYNAFLPRQTLQKLFGQHGRINLLLVGNTREKNLSADHAAKVFQRHWALSDIGVKIRELADKSIIEVQSKRIFLDRPVVNAIETIAPDIGKILTYFVKDLRVGDRSTPYSMVTAIQSPPGSRDSAWFGEQPIPDLKDGEILINSWCAEDLSANPGNTLEMNYYVLDQSRRLTSRKTTFTIRGIFSHEQSNIDHTLAPEIPGLSDSRNCREWNVGIPVDFGKIRDKDEAYWTKYKGTPKAVITLAAGQKIWSSRFGDLTALRLPSNPRMYDILKNQLPRVIDPKSVGLSFTEVRNAGHNAVTQSTDFGGLFIGFSFFLAVASLLLTGLLFILNIDQRSQEQGILLALGFPTRRIRRLYMIEGLLVSIPAGGLGMICGSAYTMAILHGLSTLWSDAVGNWRMAFHGDLTSKLIGPALGIGITIAAQHVCWICLRKRTLRGRLSHLPKKFETKLPKRFNKGHLAGIICLSLAFITLGFVRFAGLSQALGFFCSGILVLISTLAFCSHYLMTLSFNGRVALPGLLTLGVRNIFRRKWRSLSVIGIIACASFIIISLESQRLHILDNADSRSSGTGGFALIGETTHSIYDDLTSVEGRQVFDLDRPEISNVQFVPIRILEGDDASCLNLNRAQHPRLIGVDPDLFITRNAFTFVTYERRGMLESPWELLQDDFGDAVIPAIADFSTITYALGKKIGDELTYLDGRGSEVNVRLVGALKNTVLQGSLIVDESLLTNHFPSIAGHNMFLIDAPLRDIDTVRKILGRSLQDFGLELTTTATRLDEFNRVQNTYISIFQVLGGLGLILGSFGLGVLLLRNVLERRPELALINAVGFTKKSIRIMLIYEHWLLLIVGYFCGICAAIVAVFPVIVVDHSNLPWLSLSTMFGCILISGLLVTGVAVKFAMRQSLVSALRRE